MLPRPDGKHGGIGRNGLAKTLLTTQLLGSLYSLHPVIYTPLHISHLISPVHFCYHLMDEALHADNLRFRRVKVNLSKRIESFLLHTNVQMGHTIVKNKIRFTVVDPSRGRFVRRLRKKGGMCFPEGS